MSNKLLVSSLLLALATSAHAQSPATFSDIANAQSELKLQEIRNKIAEGKAKEAGLVTGPQSIGVGSASAPVLAATLPPLDSTQSLADSSNDVDVVALYGVGDSLKAEILYNGKTYPVSASGNTKAGPWTVVRITPTSVILAKPGRKIQKGKKVTASPEIRKEIFIGTAGEQKSEAKDANNKNGTLGPGFGPMGNNMGMPPMPPQIPSLPRMQAPR